MKLTSGFSLPVPDLETFSFEGDRQAGHQGRQDNIYRTRKSHIINAECMPKQTVTNMISGVGTFERWLWSQNGGSRQSIVDIPAQQLDLYLADFYSTITRSPGVDYKVESFQALKGNINRYLQAANYPECPKSSQLFARSRDAYHYRRKRLAASQSCRTPHTSSSSLDVTNVVPAPAFDLSL